MFSRLISSFFILALSVSTAQACDCPQLSAFESDIMMQSAAIAVEEADIAKIEKQENGIQYLSIKITKTPTADQTGQTVVILNQIGGCGHWPFEADTKLTKTLLFKTDTPDEYRLANQCEALLDDSVWQAAPAAASDKAVEKP